MSDLLQLYYIMTNDLLAQLGLPPTAGSMNPPFMNPTPIDFTNPPRVLAPTTSHSTSPPSLTPPIDCHTSYAQALSPPPARCPRTIFDRGVLDLSTSPDGLWSFYTAGTPTTSTGSGSPSQTAGHASRKRKRESEVQADYSEQEEKVVNQRRPPYLTARKRRRLLGEDPFVMSVEEYSNRVHCSGCDKDIQLDNRVPKSFHLQNWRTHKLRCEGVMDRVNREVRGCPRRLIPFVPRLVQYDLRR